MIEPIIKVTNLTKTFGSKTAVNDLSFEVNPGEIFAFLGANGSGKTTSIRVLLNILQATSGTTHINGKVYDDAMASMLGYLPEERGLYLNARVLETLMYFAQLKGMESQGSKIAAISYLEKVGLADKANVEIKQLSSGQQQKIQLGVAIINSPELLILDEPTKGLDPVNRELLMEMLLELNKNGSTVVFITHQMEEVERIASRLVMIKNGKRVLYGGLNEVQASLGNNMIQLTIEGNLPMSDSLYQIHGIGNKVEISPKPNITSDQILKYLVDNNVRILKFEKTVPSLNKIFIKVTEENEEQ